MTSDDSIRIDGSDPLDHAGLEAKLLAQIARDPNVRVRISVASKLPAARVTELRKLAERAGAKSIEVSRSIDTVVPPAPAKPSDAPALVVSIPADGRIIVGSRVIADADLAAELKKLYANGIRRLAIQPDASVPYGRIQDVEKAARAAGFKDISYLK